MTEQSIRYALTPDQMEPARNYVLRDADGDYWHYRNGSWQLVTYVADDPGEHWFALLQKYGPLTPFKPEPIKEF